MVTKHVYGKGVWFDLESPTRDELNILVEQFDIDSRVVEEIIQPTPYPIEISFPDYLYLILHFPTTDPSGFARNQEIDFIVGKNFIITVRYEVIDSIHNLHKVFEAEELLGLPGTASLTPASLVERIFKRLYSAIREEIEYISSTLERIEGDIFEGRERETVKRISRAGRVLLRFETALARHEEALAVFLREVCSPSFYGKEYESHAAHVMAEHEHTVALVASYRAAATELRNTNDSLLSASQNEVMRRLTVITFATFPLAVIASLFGMNTDHLPLVDSPHAFWLILLLMVAAVSAIVLFFRLRGWF